MNRISRFAIYKIGDSRFMTEWAWTRIGWRNIGRHRKRSALTMLGLGGSFIAVVVLVGWVDGLMIEITNSATGFTNGSIEINAAEFRPDRRVYDTIGGRDGTDVEHLLEQLTADPSVLAVTPRVYGGGLVSRGDGETTVGAMLIGVDPDRERIVTNFLDGGVEGRLPEPGQNEVLLGGEMARQLEVGVGDQVIMVAPGADGSLGNDLYAVAGIFRTGVPQFEAANVVLPVIDLQTLITLDPGRIHQIMVAIDDPVRPDAVATRLADVLASEPSALEAVPWTVLRPEIVEISALVSSVYGVIIALVFGIAMFGVANTMLMSTYERRREIAVMLALGSTPRSIVKTILYEAVGLGFLSLVFGVLVSVPLVAWWSSSPVDLSWLYPNITFQGAIMPPVWRVEFNSAVWVQASVALFVTALLAALYPAVRAVRVPPADTLSGL